MSYFFSFSSTPTNTNTNPTNKAKKAQEKKAQETEDPDIDMTTLISGQMKSWTRQQVLEWFEQYRPIFGEEMTDQIKKYCGQFKITGQMLHDTKDKNVLKDVLHLNQEAANTVYTSIANRRLQDAQDNNCSAEIDNANNANTNTNGNGNGNGDDDDDDDDVKRHGGAGHLYVAPLLWTRQDVQSWFQTTRLKQLAPKFSALNGLHLLALSLDGTKLKATVANSMLVGAMAKALMTIRSEHSIEEKDIRSKLKALGRPHTAKPKRGSCYPGVIALQNQGNTCYMNSCLQALLQAPVLVPFLREYKPGQSLNLNLKYRWSLLDAMADISQRAAHGEQSFRPSRIRSILSGINPRFGSGDQDDSSLVMSTILQELDRLCNLDAGVSADAGANNRPISFDAEPSPEDEETLVHDRILDSHNPNNSSIIRATMDGVLKTISYCFECNFKRVQYETFRILQLPLINNISTLNVTICLVGDPQTHQRTYEVLGYCSVVTLKAQIAASIAEEAAPANESLPVSRVMASMSLCSVRPPPPGSHKPPTGAVDDWLVVYKNADKCNSLSSEVYAVIDLAAVVSPATTKATAKANANANALVALFEVVLNSKGKPVSESRKKMTAVKFVAMTSSDRRCPITSSELIARCKHESRVGNHSQRHLDVLLNNKLASGAEFLNGESFDFSASASTRASCGRGGIVCVVLVWQAKANAKHASTTNTNKMPVANSTIDDVIYETAVCDNKGKAGDLAGIVHQLEQRLRRVTGQMNHAFQYSAPYINKVTNTYNVFNSKLRQLNRVKKALSQQLNKIDRIRKQQSLRSTQAQHDPLSNIRDSFDLLEKKIVLDNSKATFSCKCAAGCSSAFSEQRRFVHTPVNLMLVIDRFGSASRSGKFTHLVQYPVDGKLVVGKQLQHEFELFATCDHFSDSMKYGHYSANVRSLNTGDWYYTSDSRVRETKVTAGRNSIVLLYTKKRNE